MSRDEYDETIEAPGKLGGGQLSVGCDTATESVVIFTDWEGQLRFTPDNAKMIAMALMDAITKLDES